MFCQMLIQLENAVQLSGTIFNGRFLNICHASQYFWQQCRTGFLFSLFADNMKNYHQTSSQFALEH